MILSYKSKYKNLDGVFLENDYIRLCVLPILGAKIASIYYKPQDFELLFQPTKNRYDIPNYGDDFSIYDTSGSDEMFPTIDKCIYPFEGYDNTITPDHGELWSIPWKVNIINNEIHSEVKGIKFQYDFSRIITIDKDKILINYKVKNTSKVKLYYLWAFHGLINCDKDTEIILPDDVNMVMNVHNSKYLGDIGKIHNYPITKSINNEVYNLNRISPKESCKTEKYYNYGELEKGTASLSINNNRLLYKLDFDAKKLPYIGIWINEGGFKNEYNCALEPSTGFYDSLEIAKKYNIISFLNPDEIVDWNLNLTITNDYRSEKYSSLLF